MFNSFKSKIINLLCLLFPLISYSQDKIIIYVDGFGASSNALQQACENIGREFNGNSWNVTQKQTTINWFRTAGECIPVQQPTNDTTNNYEKVYESDCDWMSTNGSSHIAHILNCNNDGYQKMLAICASGNSNINVKYPCNTTNNDKEFCNRMGFYDTFSFHDMCERWGA